MAHRELLTNNLCEYTYPDTLPFEEILHPDRADDMTRFDNGILIAYGMCPPCPLQEFHQMAPENQPTHFMHGTAADIWGTDTHEVMRTTAADWDTEDMATAAADCWDLDN